MEKWNKIYLYQGLNKSVTEYYFSLIVEGIIERDTIVSSYSSLRDFYRLDRNALCIVGEAKHLFALYILGFRNFVFWAQGVVGAESYMRHHSIVRYKILNIFEKFALKKSTICFCVSKAQQKYYEKEYLLSLASKCLVMPCFNTKLNEFSFKHSNKYDNNVFCYIGSLAVWQCFEETVKLYSEIEKRSPKKCFLKIFTKDIEKAKGVINKYNVKNYLVDFVPQERLSEVLSDCKFGFLIREDNIVNRIATPTKMSTYLANGIIPIFSSCINDFSILAKEYKYLISLSDNDDFLKVLDYMNVIIQNDEVYEEYKKIFDQYYNGLVYINRLKELKNRL